MVKGLTLAHNNGTQYSVFSLLLMCRMLSDNHIRLDGWRGNILWNISNVVKLHGCSLFSRIAKTIVKVPCDRGSLELSTKSVDKPVG